MNDVLDWRITILTSHQTLIRIATKYDIEPIVDLWYEAAYYHSELDPRLKVSPDERASVRISFEKDIDSENVMLLAAETEDRVVGYISAKIIITAQVQLVSKMGFIEGITVTEAQRRRGVATTLFKATLIWFKGQEIDQVRVDVAYYNSVARKFWMRMNLQSFHYA